ncbi:MAG: hypothetical protein B6A08_04500 [Sorangiineae bacterium NIC37A_2]|jgi:hypothetical protein|nr:MAG: hypothetical protein B6A08_04500 [Sorangiineae bacterium NIC37A_2]
MQRIAAYLLERTNHLQWSDARKAEGERIRAVIERWLASKGAAPLVDGRGTYVAVDRSDASYRMVDAIDGERSWRMYELVEVTKEGRKFVTTVSVTVGHKSVVAFVTMEVGSVSTAITRIDVDPKCPGVVRDLLDELGPLYHGASRLRELSNVDGFDAGESLALEILTPERTVPFVVVSRVNGNPVLRGLDEKLARDLAGVANVYAVDEDASWALTDRLGKPFSCYDGAVRIYWPRLSSRDEPYRHPLWMATRLHGLEGDERLALERIRRQLRRTIMSASAASVVRPKEIDDIRGANARRELTELQAKAAILEETKAKATSLEEFRAIADSYAADNDQLRRDLSARDEEIERLRVEVQRLESEKQGLIFQLGQAKASANETAEVEPDAPEQDDERLPQPGEVRFYKKRYSSPSHDVFLRVGDCGHNSWQSTEKADKAKKGLARIIGAEYEWKSLQHCGSCTGGGMWKVRW